MSFYKYKYRDLKGEILDFTRLRNDLQRAISQYDFYNESLTDLDQVILEIGAGWGVSSKYLYKKGFKNIFIIEPDARVNNIAPKEYKNIEQYVRGFI
jgi:16S rRNA A1518/A1519 N6-dimethyltransferase RsmA/KsgA/DIM1 with predicted DNA glycosylase/AP lyase activity